MVKYISENLGGYLWQKGDYLVKGYNDYISTTRSWLKCYNDFKSNIQIINNDLKSLGDEIENANNIAVPPIAKYSSEPGGGTSELNSVESAAVKLMKLKNNIEQLKNDQMELLRIISKIDIAIEALENDEACLIRGHYINSESWRALGHKLSYSEEWARKKGGAALKRMALMLWGLKAVPQQLKFVFAR